MPDAKRLHNILYEEERQRVRLVNNIQGFRKAEDYFYWRMEDIGVMGYKRGQYVTSYLK